MGPFVLAHTLAFLVSAAKLSPPKVTLAREGPCLCATLSPARPVYPNSDSANLVCVRSHSTFCVSEESQFSTNWDLFTLPLCNTYC